MAVNYTVSPTAGESTSIYNALSVLPLWLSFLATLYATTGNFLVRTSLSKLNGKHGTPAPALLAFSATAMASNMYLAWSGIVGWFGPVGSDTGATLETRLYMRSEYVECHILGPMLAHLIADLVLYCRVPELFIPALLLHHGFTALLGMLALWPLPFAHHYDIFFAGLGELSNVPLGVLEVFKLVPALRERFPLAYERAFTAFAIVFAVLRLVYWPIVSFNFWSDNLVAHQTSSHRAPPAVIVIYLLGNAVLTGLQVAWGAKLFHRMVYKKTKDL